MVVLVTKESSDIGCSIREIFDYFEPQLEPSRGFFLKPNIVFPVSGDSGEVTRPRVVRAVVEDLRRRFGDAEIIIGEGTAAGTIPSENFEISGYSKLARDLDIPLVNLDTADRITIPWKYGKLKIPAIAFDKYHINLPILKLSAAAIFSGGIKNIKGLLLPNIKKKFHRLGLHEPLAALVDVVKPNLTILDCCNFFQKRNVFLTGQSPCEIDILARRLLNVTEPEYLKIALKMGMIGSNFAIENEALLDFTSIRIEDLPYKRFMNLRLWSNPRACSACRQSIRTLKDFHLRELRSSFPMYFRLLYCSIIGADLVFGSNPSCNGSSKRLLCVGDCAKNTAKGINCLHVPGCPPTKEDFLKALSKF